MAVVWERHVLMNLSYGTTPNIKSHGDGEIVLS